MPTSSDLRPCDRHKSAPFANQILGGAIGPHHHLEIPRDCRLRPSINRAIETPIRKPPAKSAKLAGVQCHIPIPVTNVNEPPAVNRLLLRRIMLPPKKPSLN